VAARRWLLASLERSLEQQSLRRIPELTGAFPHEQVYTQSLLWHEGRLYESSRLSGVSSLRRLDPTTGAVLAQTRLANRYLAGGLVRVEATLVLLTMQGAAFCHDVQTLKRRTMYTFAGEGWGACYDGSHLYVSDGTHKLVLYQPDTLAPCTDLTVTLQGQPVAPLGELECVGDSVFAHLSDTTFICQLDKTTGQVQTVFNIAGLLPSEEQAREHLLSGIAYCAEKECFYLTGKLWPQVLEVRL
jgi:glutamine cyclotransferase